MCTVEKILVKGIRSFSPDNQYHIEFYKPLTIIVGSNGAGKTTIIECLRNATTGELPPNTRQGQGFVHDPKVAGETEVKGQVKLQFRTATGVPVIVTRSYMLTQKKSTMQFKSLDAALTAPNRDTGERQTLTYRCADLDRMVPTLMGVSKAVLENVIFVHQEESNWPLAEGKVLKEKFDDIFAATKYTKALEALRKLRLEKAQGQKENKLQLENLKQVKDMAAHHASERDAARSRVAEANREVTRLEQQIQDLDGRRAALSAQLEELERAAASVEPRQAQLRMLQDQNKERRQRFAVEGRTDFEETTEQLQSHLQDFDRMAAEKQAQREALRREVNSLRIEREALAERHQMECVRQGKLAGEASAHAANLTDRDRAIRDAALALALPLPEQQPQQGSEGVQQHLSCAAAESFVGAVGGKVRQLEARVNALRADARATEGRLSSAVDAANARVAGAAEGLRLKRQQLEENQNSIAECHAQIYNTQMTAAAVRGYKEEAEEAEAAYKRKQEEEARSPLPQQVADARAATESASRRLSELRAERAAAAAAAEGSARLRVKRTDLANKQEQLENMVNARRLALTKALDLAPGEQLPEAAQLRGRVDAALSVLRREEDQRLAALQQAQKAAQEAKTAHGAVREQLNRRQADVNRLGEQVRRGLAAAMEVAGEGTEAAEADLNNCVATKEREEDQCRNKAARQRAIGAVLSTYREHVSAGYDCPVCTRPMTTPEREVCLNNIDHEAEAVPEKIRRCEEQLGRLQRQLGSLRSLQPTWVLYKDAREALPGLTAREAELREREQNAADQADTLQADYAESSARVKELSRLREEAVWAIDRLAGEVEALRRELSALDASVGASSGGPPARSVSEVDSDMEAVELQRAQAEAQRDAAQSRLSRLREEVVKAQREAMAAQQRAMDASVQANRVAELQERVKELEAAGERLQAALSEASSSLAPLEAERDRLAAQREEARAAMAAQVAEADKELRDATLLQSSLAAKQRLVSDYEARGRGREAARAAAAVEALRGQLEAAGARLSAKEAELQELDKELASDDGLRRDVQDCLDLRLALEAERTLREEVEALAAEAARAGDRASLQRQVGALGQEREAARSRQDVLRGHVAAGNAAASRAAAELAEAKYRDIGRRHTDMQVLVKTTELALQDLDKYYKALEKALLVFHTSKMSDINKIIKEMWQKTYRGQDIDYIQIKADTEGAGQRSYNYRVVMYSGAAELEMRGRCSAGQKVLACLIIRLALAETFCLNCGILALDEPTTNLDAENSASLAEALRSLMVSRSAQENFQLIVITHDERFARLIGTREYTDSLWRVTKDANQHTQVIPEEVSDE